MSNESDHEMSKDSAKLTLRDAITKTRTRIDRFFSTARAHSPFADDKLEAADDAVSAVVHSGYQYVKNIAVNGHPTVILSVAGVAAALPSIPFGARAIGRNAVLAVGLASVMIYPDHLSRFVHTRSSKE